MKKEYRARKSGVLKDKDAQVVGEILNGLKNNLGHLKTESVVAEAKNKECVLHNYFEWRNTVASRKFRLVQARNIISSVVEIVIIQNVEVPQRSFHSVQTEQGEDNESEGRVYVTIHDVLENEDYRKQLLSKIITSLENLTITMKMFREHNIK